MPLHFLFFAAYLVLFLYSENQQVTAFSDTFRAFAITGGIALAFFVPGLVLYRNPPKAALVATIVLAAVFLYGHVKKVAAGPLFGGLVEDKWFLIGWALGFYVLLAWVNRLKSRFVATTLLLNIATGILVLLPLINIAAHAVSAAGSNGAAGHAPAGGEPAATSLAAGGPKRDIYFIIFDRYAGRETLAELYGFDNRPFLGELRRRGFYVAERSFSNYLKTAQSMASSLNMEFHDALAKRMGPESPNWLPLYEKLQNFRVQRLLKGVGYKYLHLGSWWEPTRRNRFADDNFVYTDLNEFTEVLLDNSAFRAFTENFGLLGADWSNRRGKQCERVKAKLARLKSVPRTGAPTFTLAHMLIPHPPYVVDATGKCLSRAESERLTVKGGYLGQLQFVNAQILELVDALIAGSAVRPIIVIQADEGPFPDRYRQNERGFDWRDATPGELRQKVRILNAMYLPDAEVEGLHPGLTPVNTFRIVFNAYFGGKFDLLPDRSFANAGYARPYDYFDITDIVR